ncbi:hypothetical protein SAMN04490244_105166 [Tranquillimonas rosea]|uniref:Uncharacterized protein n=1 Tax=Tranquillimonas rosea TaxID=641238 RepID=A0A1H9UBV9_9RHOB|nr:hypothetical protein [Tranquillimonas rosea]SES06657.1 hypothetical protein SAMN04490244_105166 [Tranquillimonas rosea]
MNVRDDATRQRRDWQPREQHELLGDLFAADADFSGPLEPVLDWLRRDEAHHVR